ncbi:uncharacterized protein [Musca autumnalis]|uniref:uncharacterized protein n=1 Tax=Musca autumnalis TaxID=221902 RepID=UPI003CECC6F4
MTVSDLLRYEFGGFSIGRDSPAVSTPIRRFPDWQLGHFGVMVLRLPHRKQKYALSVDGQSLNTCPAVLKFQHIIVLPCCGLVRRADTDSRTSACICGSSESIRCCPVAVSKFDGQFRL